MSPETWPILERAGCRVDRDSGIVRFPPDVVEHYLSLAPSEFTLHARNPDNSIEIGGDHAEDGDGQLVYLAPTRVNLNLTIERWPDMRFLATREL